MPDPTPIRAAEPWPESPDAAAYHGLAGEIVRALDPHTEADPVGVLVSVLAGFGNAVGRRPHLVLDSKRHPLLLWPVLVGPTGTGRKGTALANAARVFERALPVWWGGREGSLSTGEGVIQRVRDPSKTMQPVKLRGQAPRYELVQTDVGVDDKRLFVAATEFGGVLRVMARESNTLSAVLRNAWDGDPLGTVTKTSYLRATGAHITVNGHITPEEVRLLLGAQEAANGFANRFLWVGVRRSKLLPLGSDPDEGELAMLGDLFARIVEDACQIERLRMDGEAADDWVRVYGDLATDEPGVVGQLLSRAEAMVQRLAGLYALLDVSPAIGLPHLRAALALWQYAEASVHHVFGGGAATPAATPAAPPEPRRRAILDALVPGALTRSDLGKRAFSNNYQAEWFVPLLAALVAEGCIDETKTRPVSGIGASITSYALTERGRTEVSG